MSESSCEFSQPLERRRLLRLKTLRLISNSFIFTPCWHTRKHRPLPLISMIKSFWPLHTFKTTSAQVPRPLSLSPSQNAKSEIKKTRKKEKRKKTSVSSVLCFFASRLGFFSRRKSKRKQQQSHTKNYKREVTYRKLNCKNCYKLTAELIYELPANQWRRRSEL